MQRKTRYRVGSSKKIKDPVWAVSADEAAGRAEDNLEQEKSKNFFIQSNRKTKKGRETNKLVSSTERQQSGEKPKSVNKTGNCSGAAELQVSWGKPRKENVLRIGCLVSEARSGQLRYTI